MFEYNNNNYDSLLNNFLLTTNYSVLFDVNFPQN